MSRDRPHNVGKATIDHVDPLSKGGPDVFENTVAACEPCNTYKANGTVEELLSNPLFLARRLKITA